MSWASRAKQMIDALGSTPTADEARVVTDRFADSDIQAAIIEKIGEGGGGGAENSVTLLGPFQLDFDTAGFFNPNDSGVETLSIPAGSFVQAFGIVTETFEGRASGDEIVLGLLENAAGSGPVLAQYGFDGLVSDTPSVAHHEPTIDAVGVRQSGFAVAACKVVVAYYPIGATTLTAGSIDIYALVATPS